MRFRRWVGASIAIVTGFFGSATGVAAQIPAPTRCAVGIPASEVSGYVPLPRGDVFCPLLADPKGQRSFVSYLHETSDQGDMNVGSVGISDAFGLLRVGGPKPGDGFQVSLAGSVFAQFDLGSSSYDLVNADYVIGLPINFRRRAFSMRFRLYHQSSHLGDEFLLRENNPTFVRENISFEAAEMILSLDGGPFRVYGGGEYLLRREPKDLERYVAHGGVELACAAAGTIRHGRRRAIRRGGRCQGFRGTGLEACREHSDGIRVRPSARYGSTRTTLGSPVRGVHGPVAVRPVFPESGPLLRRRHSLHAMTSHEQSYDVIVAGLGAMGSATVYALTRAQARSPRVLGIDRFSPPHRLGSSHGRTRIIREAYFEGPAYVPIVRRAFDLWRELEQAAGRTLYSRTRGITLGAPDGMLASGARASAEQFDVPHRVLSAAEVTRNFPGLRPAAGMVGVVEERAGVLFPEDCIATMLGLAEKAGAELRRDETVVAWEANGDGVVVRTTDNEYRATRLVIAGGAWMPRLVPELAGTLAVERQPIHWFAPDSHSEDYSAPQCPVTLWEYAPDRTFYTLPDFGDGVKAAVHYEGQSVDPDHVNRQTSPEDVARVAELLRCFMPNAEWQLRDSQVCLYTNTPDLHFIIDRHPSHADRVVVVSACSGHGFKFATAIGEIAADLVAERKPRFDLDMFRMTRFQE